MTFDENIMFVYLIYTVIVFVIGLGINDSENLPNFTASKGLREENIQKDRDIERKERKFEN